MFLLEAMGCGKAKMTSTVDVLTEIESTENEKQSKENNLIKETEKNENQWGITCSSVAENDSGDLIRFSINFPKNPGSACGSGLEAIQDKGIRILVDRQLSIEGAEKSDSIENVLPTYFQQTIDIYRGKLGISYEEGEFSISNKQMVTINGYEMCRYEGVHNLKYKGNELMCAFVAYSAQLSNGAYVYWMAVDETEEQKAFDVASEYAEKMAYTLREEE